jgi:MFS family permease
MTKLSARDVGFASLAGATWTLYNVSYIIVVSFAPLLLADRGFSAADAALVSSAATWPLIVSVPLGGILADRTGRGGAIMFVCFLTMVACIPFVTIAASPLVMLAVIGLVMGPAAGIIMAMPARALRPEARNLGMGIYYTWYYVGMALLPGLAGWSRDATGEAIAPLLFASFLMIGAIVCTILFGQLEKRSMRAKA